MDEDPRKDDGKKIEEEAQPELQALTPIPIQHDKDMSEDNSERDSGAEAKPVSVEKDEENNSEGDSGAEMKPLSEEKDEENNSEGDSGAETKPLSEEKDEENNSEGDSRAGASSSQPTYPTKPVLP